MKRKFLNLWLATLLCLTLATSCSTPDSTPEEPRMSVETTKSDEKESDSNPVEAKDEASTGEAEGKTQGESEDTQAPAAEPISVSTAPEQSLVTIPAEVSSFSLSDIPAYSGEAYIAIHENVPYFTSEDLTTNSFEVYGDLDGLGRCTTAYANIGKDIMPTEERGSIGSVKPSGWQTVRYNGVVDGNYLYNRCHLIGYQLSGENANVQNLITGTRYLNIEGMLPFENMVDDYIEETNNHVLYRVTPVFKGDNLLANGVLMEGYSVEDNGEGICFCIFAYNVQPGISIDYATGNSELDSSVATPTEPDTTSTPASDPSTTQVTEPEQTEPEVTTPAEEPEPEPEPEPTPVGTDYIGNKNTKKFHYPSCGSVKQMKESNKYYYTGTRDEMISMGYDPCKKCNP